MNWDKSVTERNQTNKLGKRTLRSTVGALWVVWLYRWIEDWGLVGFAAGLSTPAPSPGCERRSAADEPGLCRWSDTPWTTEQRDRVTTETARVIHTTTGLSSVPSPSACWHRSRPLSDAESAGLALRGRRWVAGRCRPTWRWASRSSAPTPCTETTFSCSICFSPRAFLFVLWCNINTDWQQIQNHITVCVSCSVIQQF